MDTPVTPSRDIRSLLEALTRAGQYRDRWGRPSETAMARAFGLPQQTLSSWKVARGHPVKLLEFLRRFAERHQLDAEALVRRWELVPVATSAQAAGAEGLRLDPTPHEALAETARAMLSAAAALARVAGLDPHTLSTPASPAAPEQAAHPEPAQGPGRAIQRPHGPLPAIANTRAHPPKGGGPPRLPAETVRPGRARGAAASGTRPRKRRRPA